jgi:hypothetical protein
MKTYKQLLRECGINWWPMAKKGDLKKLVKDFEERKRQIEQLNKDICNICGLPEYFDFNHIHLFIDDLYKFVKLKQRLPTFEEVKEIRSFPDFKFWFNNHMNGTDENSVWVYPSEIWTKYNSL